MLEAAVMDRRLQVAIDGRLLFDPIRLRRSARPARPSESPVALGVRGGARGGDRHSRSIATSTTPSTLANTPRQPHGVDAPLRLGTDEFFVLGDNSPVSNDSRFWTRRPGRRGRLFVGKPFLVHLPGQVVPAPGLRAVGVLGSRSSRNPLHSIESRRSRYRSGSGWPRPLERTTGQVLTGRRLRRGPLDDGTDLLLLSPRPRPRSKPAPAQGGAPRDGRGDRRGLHPGAPGPRLRGRGVRHPDRVDGARR